MSDTPINHPLQLLIDNIHQISQVYAGKLPVVEPNSLHIMDDGSIGVRVLGDFFNETSHDWWDPVVPKGYVTLIHDVHNSLLVSLRCYEGYHIQETTEITPDTQEPGSTEQLPDEAQ